MNWHIWLKGLRVMRFNKRFYKNQESGKGKRPNEQLSNEKGKGFSKGKKVICFNYGGMGYYSQECPRPKNIKKKSMQTTWSDLDSEDRAFTTSEDSRYDSNDMLTFVVSMKHENDSDCDGDSDDDEFIDEQMTKLFDNLVVEHEKLIKSYKKNHEVLDIIKIRLMCLC